MAQAARLSLRMQKELKLLLADPPPGASFPFLSADSDLSSLTTIDAQVEGPEDTVYAKGIFHVKVQIPERYPFHPPIVTFVTPIYHPNIDTGGRICLDILNLPPKGGWQPSLNISTVLTSIGLLLSEPNPDDGLMCEASKEYKYNRQAFEQKARSMTEKYAKAGMSGTTSSCHVQYDSHPNVMVGLDKGSECEVKEVASGYKKPTRISEKLSLEVNKNRSCEENHKPIVQPSSPLDSRNHIESNPKDKEGKAVCDEINPGTGSFQLTRKRLSLSSSAPASKIYEPASCSPKSGTVQCQAGQQDSEVYQQADTSQTNSYDKGVPLQHPRKDLKRRSLGLKTSLHRPNRSKENAPPLEQLLQVNQDQGAKVLGAVTDQRLGEPVAPETVIVLDSEDSEEEGSGQLRSKISFARRCMGKKIKN